MKRLYRSKYLVTSNADHAVYEDAFMAVDKDTIVGVGFWKDRPRSKDYKAVDYSNAVIIPGLFNLHAHLAMTFLKGIVEDVDLNTWLFNYIFPAEKKLVSKKFVQLGTELALTECLKNGTTYVADMYFHPEQVMSAFSKVGLRGTLGVSFFDQGGMDTKSLDESIELVRSMSKKIKKNALLDLAVAPHAPYTCSKETLKRSVKIAKELHLPAMIHVAETKHEFDEVKSKYGQSPLQYVFDSGLFDLPYLLLAHMIYLEAGDFKLLEGSKATPILNPQCNAKLASGTPIAQNYKDQKIRFALGTDGSASNNSLDIFSELNFLAKLLNLQTGRLDGISSRELFDAVTIRAAEAVGKESELGSLEAGKQADFVVIPLDKAHLFPVNDIYSQLIYVIRGQDVNDVYIKGRAVLKNKRVRGLDETELLRKCEQYWKASKKAIKTVK